jgi:hypothetical protein
MEQGFEKRLIGVTQKLIERHILALLKNSEKILKNSEK